LRAIWLPDVRRARENAMLLWTLHTQERNDLSALAEIAIAKRFLAIPVGIAVPSELSALRRLDWTNAQYVYWQWRVTNGAPADHVHRPLPPQG
jgi:hypothetical protein